jgi:hypothetical protein
MTYPPHLEFSTGWCYNNDVGLDEYEAYVPNAIRRAIENAKAAILSGELKTTKMKFNTPTLTGMEHDSLLCKCERNAWDIPRLICNFN